MLKTQQKAGITLLASLLLLGCTARDRMLFGDGIASLTGRGGEVARADAMPSTRSLARELGPQQPKPAWSTTLPEEGCDFATFLEGNRLLVGTVESGAYLGVPDLRDIILYDTTTGEELWRSTRPAIRNGHYSVVTVSPAIVLAGWGEGKIRLLGYKPDNGVRLWDYQAESPFQVLIEGSALLVTSFADNTWTVAALDAASGAVRWEKKVKTRADTDRPARVAIGDGTVFLVSEEIHALDLADGKRKWSGAPLWRPYGALDLHELADGYLLVGQRGLVRFERSGGMAAWHHDARSAPIRASTLAGSRIYLLRGKGPLLTATSPAGESEFFIEAVGLKQGKPLWSKPLRAPPTSPLIHLDNRLVFATEDRLTALDAVSGKKAFERTLPVELIEASPTKARFQGVPDALAANRGNLILARELYGVAAFSLRDGRRLWQQPHYLSPANNPYTVDHQVNVLQQTLKQYGYGGTHATAAATDSFDSRQRESLILQSMRRSAEHSIAQADRELTRRDTTRLGGRIARTSKITAVESNIVAERMAQNREAIQAARDLMMAGFALADALADALKRTAHKGLFERLAMKLHAGMAARAHAFQGDYYVWPFQERGRGLTLIQLDTGKRIDLIFAPMVPPLTELGVDLPTYAVSPEGNRLVTFGVPLDERRYEEYVKWKWRIPRAATLAYDVDKLPFSTKSKTARYWEENLKTDLVEWAYRGNLAKVRALIANGADVNQEKYAVTPLWMAILRGHNEVVEVLIENGANVNWEHTMMNLKPLEMARNIKASQHIIGMLERAGAKE